MLNIVLLCAYGASTGLLVSKLKAETQKRKQEAVINAYGIDEAGSVVGAADIVLLGPQMRTRLKDLEKEYPDSTFMVIDTLAYGRMKADKILDAVDEKLSSVK